MINKAGSKQRGPTFWELIFWRLFLPNINIHLVPSPKWQIWPLNPFRDSFRRIEGYEVLGLYGLVTRGSLLAKKNTLICKKHNLYLKMGFTIFTSMCLFLNTTVESNWNPQTSPNRWLAALKSSQMDNLMVFSCWNWKVGPLDESCTQLSNWNKGPVVV